MSTKKVAFIHPDLGIGGAEQLVVNLCLGAIQNGYEAHIFTPYHHKSFPETHDGTIMVHEHGSFYSLIPATIFGKLKGILAYLRTLICVLWLISYDNNYTAIVVDQVSFVLPFLKLAGNKTIFYCHYPDKLLAGKRNNLLKKIYRFVIDSVEQISLIFADKIYVNSQFTRKIFYQSFPFVNKIKKIEAEILYPAIDFRQFDQETENNSQTDNIMKEIGNHYFFSLNRYERKKNINLAVEAFATLTKENPELSKGYKLVIAGGYDNKVKQNIEHHQQLVQLAQTQGISDRSFFLVSISNNLRKYLLKNAKCILYTPKNEHFGIVPCQAMYCNVPVLADNSGGPIQSIGNDGSCGYLIDGGRNQWAAKMKMVIQQNKQQTEGRKRTKQLFGFNKFSQQFTKGIVQVSNKK